MWGRTLPSERWRNIQCSYCFVLYCFVFVFVFAFVFWEIKIVTNLINMINEGFSFSDRLATQWKDNSISWIQLATSPFPCIVLSTFCTIIYTLETVYLKNIDNINYYTLDISAYVLYILITCSNIQSVHAALFVITALE